MGQARQDWLQTILALPNGIPSHDAPHGKAALHLVSAWGARNGLVLGQLATDAKSNEITAIPQLLRLLNIQGCTVTIDAMGCQKTIARQIVQQGGDYLLALKHNHPTLHQEDVQDTFRYAAEDAYQGVAHDHVEQVEKAHGRIETRRYTDK